MLKEVDKSTNNSLTCPFCQAHIPNMNSTFRIKECYFNKDYQHTVNKDYVNTNIFDIKMLYCPSCNNVSFVAEGRENLKEYKVFYIPIV